MLFVPAVCRRIRPPRRASMHIVHVVDHFHPRLGYQESSLAREHARMGHRVTVITSDRHFRFPNYERVYLPLIGPRLAGAGVEETDGLRIVRLPARLEMRGFVFCPGLPRALREAVPDVVIHHGLLHPNFFLTALAARRARWPLVADSHMAVYNTDIRAPAQRAYLGLHRLCLSRFVRRRARVVAIGPAERRLLAEVLPGVESTLIPLGADAGMFAPDPARRAAARSALGYGPDDVVVLHAGKFLPDKRTLDVVRAYREARADCPALRLLLVGGGAEAFMAEVRAETAGLPGVTLRDLAPHAELPALVAAADIGAWPGSPSNVFLEAMASGLPLLLQKGEYAGFLLANGNGFEVADAAALAARLRELGADAGLRRTLSERGRERFERDFRWDRVAARFLELGAR